VSRARRLTEVELAWAAGTLESDGCISINSTPGHEHITVVVTNCDRSIPRYFLERWDGSIRSQLGTGARRTVYRWTVASRKAEGFLRDVLPYLWTDRSVERATIALEFRHTGDRDLIARMRQLNRRGRLGPTPSPAE
jgi:hypothetical protein